MQVVVAAGGFGTRSENPEIPKSLQSISPNEKLIDYQLKHLVSSGYRNVCFVLGHKAQVLESYLQECREKYPAIEIGSLVEDQPIGTAPAVLEAVNSYTNTDLFLLLLGDTLIDAPLDHYFHLWMHSRSSFGVVCHPNLHMQDSDVIEVDERGIIRAFQRKGSGRNSGGNEFYRHAITGAAFFRGSLIKENNFSEGDFMHKLIDLRSKDNRGVGIITSHYFADSGTSARLEQIREDVASGIATRRGNRLRGAVFLDRDGTILEDKKVPRSEVGPREIPDDVVSAVKQCNQYGVPVFVVTNQAGIAKGQIVASDVYKVHNQINDELASFGAYLDDAVFCPHYPESGFVGEVRDLKTECECRKPKSGMIQQIADRHLLNLNRSLLIGDSETDRLAAESAGCRFEGATWDGKSGTRTGDAILKGLNWILNDCN